MDRYVIATIHPFVLGQEVTIYENDKCSQVFETTLENMPTLIYKLCEQYDINKVNFVGGQLYALKFKDEFAACKYGKRHIDVHIQ